jgi:hypothetical protein
MATYPTQMRLTENDKKALDLIRSKKNLSDRTAATRYAIEVCVATLQSGKKNRKKEPAIT